MKALFLFAGMPLAGFVFGLGWGWVCQRGETGERESPAMIGIVFALAFFAAACLLGAFGAAAHPGDDARAEWLRGLQTPGGMSCCNQQDCHPTDAMMRDGQWWVTDPTRTWEPVPADRVLTTPNLDGRAVVCRTPSGEIRCFVPPASS